MKPLASAKSRLGPATPDVRRQAAALHMLDRVLEAVVKSCGREACQVVGGDELVRRVAEGAGCRWLPEPGRDLNSSLWAAMQACFRAGAGAVLFLPADLPQATPSDVAAVVVASRGLSQPTGVPAERDGGTNALLMPASIAFPPRLGTSSYARHAEEARLRGMTIVEARAPGLTLDVDTPEDLAWAEEHVEGFGLALDDWARWLRQHEGRTVAPTGIGGRRWKP